jgi:hypothetical protein
LRRPPGVLSPALLNLLLDAMALAFRGWRAPKFAPGPFLAPILFADAANNVEGYRVGLCGPSLIPRCVQLGDQVSSQQEAELWGLIEALKLALHVGFHSVDLVGDNKASLSALLSLKPYRGFHPHLSKLLRGLYNHMWDKHLHVRLWWAPSALLPADPMSRVSLSSQDSIDLAIRDTQRKTKHLLANLSCLKLVGCVSL